MVLDVLLIDKTSLCTVSDGWRWDVVAAAASWQALWEAEGQQVRSAP